MKWEHVMNVESESKPGIVYKIKRAADGRIGCDCERYRFMKGSVKTCKHIVAAGLSVREAIRAAGPAVQSVSIVNDGEKFLVSGVRGIALGGGLAAAFAAAGPARPDLATAAVSVGSCAASMRGVLADIRRDTWLQDCIHRSITERFTNDHDRTRAGNAVRDAVMQTSTPHTHSEAIALAQRALRIIERGR